MKNDPVQSALAALDNVPLRTPEGRAQLVKALASKSNLVAAKAARITGDAQWVELADDLVKAFDRFITRGSIPDKGCVALIAIARALYGLDYDDAELFLKGMRHVQMEPVWGGSVDTAVELRAVCAMGLASTRYSDTLRELVDLLADSEWQARAGAARAIGSIAANGSEAASLLLRLKALTGDREPDVIADCFSGLLGASGQNAVRFVTSFAEARDPEVRDAAILSLGASRRPEAIEWLKERFGAVADVATRKCILLSLATSRTEAAMEFLLVVIRDGSEQASAMAVAAMEISRADPRIQAEVTKALQERARKYQAPGCGDGRETG
jgi:HEAT repeat protein